LGEGGEDGRYSMKILMYIFNYLFDFGFGIS
jgi:hypothetical protein